MVSRKKVARYAFLLTAFPIVIAIFIGFLIIIFPSLYDMTTNTNLIETCDYSYSLYCAMFYDIMPTIIVVLTTISFISFFPLFTATVVDAIRTKKCLWTIFLLLAPLLSLLYYILNMRESPDKSQS